MDWEETRNATRSVRDRRQGRRYLTRKNVIGSFIALLLAFLVVSLYSERQGASKGEFRRLYKSRISDAQPVPPPKVETVAEAPIPEGSVDPLSLRDASTSADLGLTAPPLTGEPTTTVATSTTPLPPGVEHLRLNSNRESSRISISGGPEGVQIAAH